MQAELEAGVIVEAGSERGREFDTADIDAARGEEAGAALEQIERRIEIEFGVGRKRAQRGERVIRIA